jgi:hypothetical protein
MSQGDSVSRSGSAGDGTFFLAFMNRPGLGRDYMLEPGSTRA